MIGVVDKYDELKNELARIRDKYNLCKRNPAVIGCPLECILELERFIDNLGNVELTCSKCKENRSCPHAFDLYNLNGDCLAEK